MRLSKKRLTVTFWIACCLMGFGACSSLPKDVHRPPSTAIDNGIETRLGQTFTADLADHPNQSGVILLGNGLDAFAGRVVLAKLAERSLDLQYYMLHQDTVGQLLIDQLIKAADRGGACAHAHRRHLRQRRR